jgi:C4-dicarboxylate transporter DctM subunit
VLGGIYSGIFTPTESAEIASVYAIVIGVFVYRELTSKTHISRWSIRRSPAR